VRRCSYAIAYTSSVASSRLIGWAGRVGEVGCSRCGVGLRDGFADVAVGLPVRLLAVAVAVVSGLAARAAAACGFTRACCARLAGERTVQTFGAGHGTKRME